ncbi:uncharacterized protein PG998_015065 [Apiospora kogelbergensis]|uniref:uncharacterized protein n=1 Tax=Apiospora kogelbergensis TaxID=1337665 RepID=UPI00312F92DE
MAKLRHDPFSDLPISVSSDSEDEKPNPAPPAKKRVTGKGAAVATSSSGKTAQSSGETPRDAAAREKAAAQWMKKWERAGYPKALLRQVSQFREGPTPNAGGAIAGLEKIPIPNAVHKAMSLATGTKAKPSPPAVYLITYIHHGKYVGFEHEVLGIYSNLAAANDYVLGVIPSHPTMCITLGMEEWQRGTKADYGVTAWDVDRDGCLSIGLQEEDEKRVSCTRQEVRDKPPTTHESQGEERGAIHDDWVSEF